MIQVTDAIFIYKGNPTTPLKPSLKTGISEVITSKPAAAHSIMDIPNPSYRVGRINIDDLEINSFIFESSVCPVKF
ncbi:MAG: hypothetical protein Ct9H90mP18_04610 [Gammaproteobacteria bacterium]|nr:MAG: hypothetical protein Ct9H90mP18_04610 [Gammaproteobacteria bacterium]